MDGISSVSPVQKAFQINGDPSSEKSTARLPTLGTAGNGPLERQFPLYDVDGYLGALHASIGDTANVVKNHLVEAAKAIGAEVPQAFSYSTMSFMPDPANYGLMQWPGLNPESLRKIARENVAQQMIVRSRVVDLARYSGLSTHPWKPGWHIIMRDASSSPSRQDKADIRDAERFIWNCSREYGYGDARERDAHLIPPFEMFLRSFGDDAHTFDGWAIWTDMDGKGSGGQHNRSTSGGGVRSFVNLPAGMIRLAVPTRGYKGDSRYFAAMIDETGTPVRPFTRDELTWRVRNVRLDPAVCGYGWPESEMAIKLIAGFTSAIDLNVTTFTSNSIPNGMLLLKGDYFQQEQIDALMREWTNMKRGVSKLWGLPVMAVPEDGDVKLIEFMDMKGKDVWFKEHMNMMAGLTCVIYNFPVRRLGLFTSGQHKDNQPVPDGSVDIQGVDDPGLPALLMHVENTINEYLLWSNWPNLVFEFLNKNPKEDARAYEARKLARTWKESRAEADLPSLSSLAPAHLKPLVEIMELAPEDPGKAGIFQTVAVKMLEAELGLDTGGGEGGNDNKEGARMPSKTDPASSAGHGHMSGVRRNSRAEKDSAAGKVT